MERYKCQRRCDNEKNEGRDIRRWKEGVSGNCSHMEMWRLDRRVRDWKNDKCVGQSIRFCQTDGKLESGVTLRQIDTIRSTKMNSH